jgi:hypothetical protein
MKNHLTRIVFTSSFAAGAMMLANVASAQCDLAPIAISANAIASVNPGTEIKNIHEGDRTGDFVWLTWTGSQSDADLLASLSPAGNSYTYVDPTGAGNDVIENGSLIAVKDNAPDGRRIHAALKDLAGDVVIVPVCDTVTELKVGTEHHQPVYETVCHVVGFAQVQIISYALRPGDEDRLTVLYLGMTSCSSGPAD